MNFYQFFIFFILYSILGWICEVIYCSLINKKLTNRGFLYGPLCPIYGTGAIVVHYVLFSFSGNYNYIVIVFVVSIIMACIIEYFTSYVMEKLFHLRWWDYSNYKFNLNGRICLLNAIEFGILAVLMVYVLNPPILKLIYQIPTNLTIILAISLLIIFVVDLSLTIASLINLRGTINKAIEEYKDRKDAFVLELDEIYNGKISKYIFKMFINKFPSLKLHKIKTNNLNIHENIEIIRKKFNEKILELRNKNRGGN